MKVRYITTLAIASIFAVGLTAHSYSQSHSTSSEAIANKVCAGKNPCAGNPCAGNPCAGKNPCAGNPCAGNPCAGKNPCAGATKHPPVFSDKGVAIRGADPVAYFTQSKAVMGKSQYQHQWQGTTWYFESAQNRDRFVSNPSQYAPQYGGYCAKAVSEGNLAPVDPNAWTVYQGKLYLNYSKDVQAQWSRDIPGNIVKANRHWPAVLNR